jgi:23S rRNA (uracil747-C5)-methyltransferase
VGSDAPPDLVIVNPPRRGIGPELSGWLEGSGVRHVLYSSCNAQSLARDLAAMPSLRPVRGRLLDMFPHTTHYEALTLLERS